MDAMQRDGLTRTTRIPLWKACVSFMNDNVPHYGLYTTKYACLEHMLKSGTKKILAVTIFKLRWPSDE